jgi:hypothetical protein
MAQEPTDTSRRGAAMDEHGSWGGQGRRTRGLGSRRRIGSGAQHEAGRLFASWSAITLNGMPPTALTGPAGHASVPRVEQQCLALLQSIPPSTTGSANHVRAHDWLRDIAKTLFIPSDSQLRPPPPLPSHPERQSYTRSDKLTRVHTGAHPLFLSIAGRNHEALRLWSLLESDLE